MHDFECPFCDYEQGNNQLRCDRCGGVFEEHHFTSPESEVSVVPGKGILASPKFISANPALFLRPRQMLLAQLGNEINIVQHFTDQLLGQFIAQVQREGGILKPEDVWKRFSGPYRTDGKQFEMIAKEACGVLGLNSQYWWLPTANMICEPSLSYAVAFLYCSARESKNAANWEIAKTVGAVALGGIAALLGWFAG